jgi:hypothetical protein
MSSSVEGFVVDRIASAPVEVEPFPHCLVDGIFPAEFFERLLDAWPEDGGFRRLVDPKRVGKAYSPQRLIIELDGCEWERLGDVAPFWREEVFPMLQGPRLARAFIDKFARIAAPRVAGARAALRRDAVLVSDRTSYSLGPHTDAPHRLVSGLFYLPMDRWTFAEAIGTTLYRPKEAGFTCTGGPSYPFDAFVPAKRVAFLPNRLFLFPKTLTSFHGVERISVDRIDRRMLLFDLRLPAGRG